MNSSVGFIDLPRDSEARANLLDSPFKKPSFHTLPPPVQHIESLSETEPLLSPGKRIKYESIDYYSSSEETDPDKIRDKNEKRAARRLLVSTNGVMLIISLMALSVLSEQWWQTVLTSFVVIFSTFSIFEVLSIKSGKESNLSDEDFVVAEDGTLAVQGVSTLTLIFLMILQAAVVCIFAICQLVGFTFAGENVKLTAETRCMDWMKMETMGHTTWGSLDECKAAIADQLKWEYTGCSIVFVAVAITISWHLSKLRVTVFYDTNREKENREIRNSSIQNIR